MKLAASSFSLGISVISDLNQMPLADHLFVCTIKRLFQVLYLLDPYLGWKFNCEFYASITTRLTRILGRNFAFANYSYKTFCN